ncbi:mtss1-like protein [Dermatophagoides farinae]|uniref:Mtss1-like protein n=1 Tax=Dermatophagoides farinae TaxID=6954 RepID=A0A9D4P1P8_DERFA|nr:myb-like protein D isoform X2 [Dermatophagoides farinae]KAH7642328.1 mtss1-like protein [Dermatophagoides farinae]
MMMEQSTITEHDCNVLGGLFQIIINDLKNGSSTWDDFILKATKFQAHLKSTINASTAFLDSFQKIADMATTTRGGTKEIGTALTRLCLRQRSVEAKLKSFSSAFLDCLILPLQERVEEWKKATIALDKERTKELKRLRQEFKKRQFCDSLSTSGSIRGNKKHSSRSLSKSKFDFFDSLNSKGIYGTIGGGYHHKSTSSLTRSLDSEMECNERLLMLEDLEKKAVRRALIEERSHFCLLVKFLRPFIEEEISMIGEISHIQEIMDSLQKLTVDPFDLPVSSETVISNLKLNKNDTSLASWSIHTPPSSPSSLGSRKSSMCSISSYNSSSSNSAANYIHHQHHQTPNHQTQSKYFSTTDPLTSTVYGSNVSYSDNNLKKIGDNDLQFQIDSISSSNNSEKNTIKITSTNPFLSSYNQIQNKNDDPESFYDKNPTSSISSNQTYLLPSHESDGSITPTNADLQKSLMFTTSDHSQNSNMMNSIYKSEEKIYQKSNKPPPAPPVRRTSSLSNPNAITLGTLKNNSNNFTNNGNNNKHHDDAVASNVVKNSSLYDEINVLTKSMNDINFTLKNTDFTNISSCSMAKQSDKTMIEDKSYHAQQQSNPNSERDKNDYKIVKKIFESYNNQQQPIQSSSNIFKSIDSDDGSQLPLPAPPPEAFIAESTIATTMPTPSISSQNTSSNNNNNNNHHHYQSQHHHHYNKITNVHREFLETLNTKLSQSPLVYQNNAKISKRRNSSNRSIPDDNMTSSYSGKHRHSHRSQSASRSSSRKNSIEKNNGFTVSSSLNNESFVDKLSQTLLQKQQQQQQQQHNVAMTMNEIAKAAASSALQRKQSVPELNSTEQYNPSFKNQNRVTFSSSLNLSTSGNSGGNNNNQAFQVVEIQTNSTQQPIYASRTQLQREIHNLYGTLGHRSDIYTDNSGNGHQRSSSYYHQQNGFFNKL